MSRITAERAAAVLLGGLDEVWRYALELDHTDASVVAVLRWLRRHGLAEYRPPDRDVHPVGEWAASDIGQALADSYRDGERSRDAVVAILARMAAGEPVEQILTEADIARVEDVREEMATMMPRASFPPARPR